MRPPCTLRPCLTSDARLTCGSTARGCSNAPRGGLACSREPRPRPPQRYAVTPSRRHAISSSGRQVNPTERKLDTIAAAEGAALAELCALALAAGASLKVLDTAAATHAPRAESTVLDGWPFGRPVPVPVPEPKFGRP